MHPRQEYHSIWHYKYSMWLDIKRLLFELFKLCASDRFAILALAAVTSHRNDTYPKGMNWHKRPVFMRRLWRQPTIVICMFRSEAYMFVIMLWVADDSRSDSTYESQQSNLFEWMEKKLYFSFIALDFLVEIKCLNAAIAPDMNSVRNCKWDRVKRVRRWLNINIALWRY